MCGIAGILRLHDPKDGPPPHPLEAIPEAWLDVLDKSIKHRGPDGQGRFRDRTTRDDGTVVDVAFVHRRLSIIDHEGGHQPMVHDGKRLRPDLTYQPGETPKLAHELCPADESPDLVAVVFNGCIYNHRELRAELEAQGHVFETDHSDTEALVGGFRAQGLRVLGRIDAMHGAGLWSRAGGQLSISRDNAGEKPVHTREIEIGDHRVFAFASSVPGLIGMDGLLGATISPLDAREVMRWLRMGWNEGFPDFYGGELPPGEVHGLKVHTTGEEAWWEIDPVFDDGAGDPAPIQHRRGEALTADRLDELIRDSVRQRLEADVPVALLLSGGLDSAIIGAHIAGLGAEVRAVTVRMPSGGYDESEDAAETARTLGIRHDIVECSADPGADLIRLIEGLGLPFGDSSLLPASWACRGASAYARVLIGGDGGDELFAGYERHRVARLPRVLRPLMSMIPSGLMDRRDPTSKASKLARLGVAARHAGYDDLLSIFPTPDLVRLNANKGRFLNTGPLHIDAPEWDFCGYLPFDLLRKSDTASMVCPLELRSPLLSRALIRACWESPLDALMPGGVRKGLLKQVARRYLPDHIVDRPKRGFAIPVGQWFRSDYGGMRQLLYDHLESADPFPGLGEAGVELNMAFVRRMLREHDAAGERSLNPWHGRDHSQRLYMLLVLSIWAKWLDRVRRGDA